MHELWWLSIPPLSVAVIYCIWRRYFRVQVRQASKLRHRVTQLLWVLATQGKTKTVRPPDPAP